MLVETIYWHLTKPHPRWGDETPDRISPAVLRLTDNPNTEAEELWIESPDRERRVTLLHPAIEVTNDRLKISGTVERTPPKIEHIEEWEAIPLTGQDGQSAPWRVEITADEHKEVILAEEPATLSEEMWYRDRRGRLAPEDQALLDEWGHPRGDPIERLVVRWAGGNARAIDDYAISRLLPFEFTIAGVTKHYGQEVDVTVILTPSRIPEVTASLGG